MTDRPTTHYVQVRQRGAVLFTALVFLVVVTLIALASIRSSTLELRMSLNEESRVNAFQRAQALTDVIIATPGTTPVVGAVGYRICTPSPPPGEVCDQTDLVIPEASLQAAVTAGHLSAVVERLGSERRPPPRGIESSVDKFGAAAFRVQSTYDRADEALGRAVLNEGVLVLVPKL